MPRAKCTKTSLIVILQKITNQKTTDFLLRTLETKSNALLMLVPLPLGIKLRISLIIRQIWARPFPGGI